MKAAIAHQGLSVIDVISPCVTFNDHVGSTKSYSYMKEHEEVLHDLDFVPFFEDITSIFPRAMSWTCRCTTARTCGSASCIRDYDPTDRLAALQAAGRSGSQGRSAHRSLVREYRHKPTFVDLLNLSENP